MRSKPKCTPLGHVFNAQGQCRFCDASSDEPIIQVRHPDTGCITVEINPRSISKVDAIHKLDATRAIIAKWEKEHIKPGSEWHAQECCVDELIAELNVVLL